MPHRSLFVTISFKEKNVTFNDCFHEICHLWVMAQFLGYESGLAFVAYDSSTKGMLSIQGYGIQNNGYSDIENGLAFMVAGMAGDEVNNQIDPDRVFELFSTDEGYSQDYIWFKKLYKTSVQQCSLTHSEEEWFDGKYESVKEFLKVQDIDKLRDASHILFTTNQYILSR